MQGEVFRRRRLPHWDVPGAIYFVTTCLDGSIPAQGILDISDFRQQLEKRGVPKGLTKEQWKICQRKMILARVDEWLDKKPAARHLQDTELAKKIVESMNYFAGERYDLFAFVVMPSHFHWVFQPREDWVQYVEQVANLPEATAAGWQPAPRKAQRTPRERIMHTLKLHTALECNRLLKRRGIFWQDESYDHCVFDDEELGRIIQYVENNPVLAGLCSTAEEYPFSSASERGAGQIPYEQPLPRGAGCQPA